MNLLIATLLILSAVLPTYESPQTLSATAITGRWSSRLSDSWTRRDGERWISLRLERDGDHDYGFSIRESDLEAAGIRGGLPSSGDIRFSLRRDAGTFSFDGRFDAGRGSGTFRFESDRAFVSAQQAANRTLSTEDVLRFAIHDVSRSFIADIEAQGYKDLSTGDLLKMRIHGVDGPYIAGLRKAGYDKLVIDELIRTRIHGVTPAYVVEMRNAGYTGLSIE